MFTVNRTDSDNKDFVSLIKLLDAELHSMYGQQQQFYDQFNKVDKIKQVVIAVIDDNAVGCGAIKKFDDDSAEVKRMFVKKEYRGKQIASKILQELEAWAAELGFSHTVLETGVLQDSAIALYQKAGYSVIPNYGQYTGVESSVCMKKRIGLK